MKLSNIFFILIIVASAAIISCEGTNDPAFKGNVIPLEAGKTWVYEHTEYDNDGSVSLQTESEVKISKKAENNMYHISNLFIRMDELPIAFWYYNDDDGFYSAGFFGDKEELLFKYPAKRGDVYFDPNHSTQRTVLTTDTLIFLAKRESKCYGYESKAVENPDSYALTFVEPGVGIVQYSRYSISETDTILKMKRRISKVIRLESSN